MLPSPDILNDFEHGKYVLSNLAAKRAKQLSEGAQALVRIESNHPLTIALAEIAAGKIKPILASDSASIDESVEMSLITDDPLPAEFGMLLPALDESDVAIFDDEHEEVVEAEAEMSLSDLSIEDEEATTTASDDDTLSLSDIAEQESIDEETEE